MKRAALLVLLALAGCGGSPSSIGFKTVYTVTPDRASVATGGSVDLVASVLEGGYTDLDVSVREGAEGGTVAKISSGHAAGVYPLSSGATYTAPADPGTFHVVVRFLEGTKVEATETATITVVVPP